MIILAFSFTNIPLGGGIKAEVDSISDKEDETSKEENYLIHNKSTIGLTSFMERQGKKPYELFLREEGLMTQRLIFEDQDYGTEVWMIDNSPTVDHANTASVWPAWNVDATLLHLSGNRPGPDGMQQWFVNGDYTNMIPYAQGSRPIWDHEDPNIYFIRRDGELIEGNAQTGEVRTIATWEPYQYERDQPERSYGLTRDNKKIFVDTPNGGTWIPYEPADVEIPQLGLHDGRPAAPQPDGTPSYTRDYSEILVPERHSTLRADDEWGPREPEQHNIDEWGPLFRIRTGFLIDRETGEMEHIIAPVSGETEYLRTFISDRIQLPEGPRWEKYRVHKSDDLEEMFDIYRYYPTMTHGHETPSPDGKFFAKDANPTEIINISDGSIETINLSEDGSSYHAHWERHPRFFLAWVRGWHFRNFNSPENANVLYQVFSDQTAQPIFNTRHNFNGYYSGGDFSMLSPDATKVHTASSMTGRFRNYIAVMARPRPPKDISWTAEGDAVTISWQPSDYHKETKGYMIYRSEYSGDGYELLTSEPVDGLSWRDENINPGTAYYYVVTSVENSGLESGYSAEAARSGIDLPEENDAPLVVYVEAEQNLKDIYTDERPGLAIGADRREASDWYYTYRHPDGDSGEIGLNVNIPAESTYSLWARVRSEGSEESRWNFSYDGADLETITDDETWQWVRAGKVSLPEGEVELILSTNDEHAQIDLLSLANNDDFQPDGVRPEDTAIPATPEEIQVENVEERTNHLTWKANEDPAFSHYNVYASREPIDVLQQEHLIGSPGNEEMIDWGLRADTQYYYAITSVDRQRNESNPAFGEIKTPSAEIPPVEMELAFAEAELNGPFLRSSAGGLRSEEYVVPEDPENTVSWEIDVPADGDYYFWLRHLQRSDGARGNSSNQNISVLLNGEQITTLGGGLTDIHAPDGLIEEGHPLAPYLWTWAWPGVTNLEGVHLPAGQHTLTLENLAGDVRTLMHETFSGEVRYDVLLLTNEPSYYPEDGRIRQR